MAQGKTQKAAEDAQTSTKANDLATKVEQTKVQETTASNATTQADTEPQEEVTIFDQAVGFVLKERIEGGYVNDKRDPGGETNYGIAKRSHPRVNIRDLTRDQAIAIYKSEYWDAAKCDDLPPKIAVAVFDCAVNQGVGIAARLIQKAAGATSDGIIGPKTLAAINRADEDDLVVQFLGWRLRRYAFTANASTYMRGWSNRVLYLQNFLALELEVA